MKGLKKFLAIPALVISAALYHKFKERKNKKEEAAPVEDKKEETKKEE